MDISITVTVFTSTRSVKLKMKFNPRGHTPYDIKKHYCDHVDNTKDPDKFSLRNNKDGKLLTFKHNYNDKVTLEACGVIGKFLNVTITARARGGAQHEEKTTNILNSNRDRKLNKSDPYIKVTNKPCCVYGDKQGDRAEMPCGCGFSPDSMFQTLRALLRKNDYEYIIKCPGCGKQMDFDLCAKIADLNDKEYEYFLRELGKRSRPETQPCPDCGIDCERPGKLTLRRINCTACSGGDWCFVCAKSWKGGGFTVCGNRDCQSYSINIILGKCPMKRTKKEYGSVNIPEVRACPNCLHYIEHKEACKHMKCEKCGHEFCFGCLKPKLSKGWQCGNYKYQCNIAPRQQF